jgi:hypothetical protein
MIAAGHSSQRQESLIGFGFFRNLLSSGLTALLGMLLPLTTAYATGPGPSVVCRNTDGRNEYFYVEDVESISKPSTVTHEWETHPGGTHAIASLGGETWQIFAPGCARNAAGQMHVFVVGTDDNAYVKWQTRPSDSMSYIANWDGRLGSPPRGVIPGGNVDAVYNSSGTIELFGISCDSTEVCQMYRTYQITPNGVWSYWLEMGGNFVNSHVKVTRYGHGGAHVRGVGLDGNIWCNFRQTATAQWSGWTRSNCNF